MLGSLHRFNHGHLDRLEAKDMCQVTQYRPVMSLDYSLILDVLTPRDFAGRLLKDVDPWTSQRPHALNKAIESTRGCLAQL